MRGRLIQVLLQCLPRRACICIRYEIECALIDYSVNVKVVVGVVHVLWRWFRTILMKNMKIPLRVVACISMLTLTSIINDKKQFIIEFMVIFSVISIYGRL